MQEFSADDVYGMVAHWLNSPANRRFGTGYGNDLADDLMTPQHGGAIERSLRKLTEDVPIAAAGGVNAYTNPVGVDGMDLFVECAGVLINATEVQRGQPAKPLAGLELRLSPSITTLQSTDAGVWTGLAASATLTVVRDGADITGACTFDATPGPGVTVTRTGAVVALASIEAGQATGYVDVSATGPFDGTITRRWNLSKDFSVSTNPFAALERFVLRFEGDLTDTKGHVFLADGPVSFASDGAGGQVLQINGATTGNGGANVVYGQSADFDLQGDFCLEVVFSVDANASRPRYPIRLASGGVDVAQVWVDTSGGTTPYLGASFRTSAGALYQFSGPAYTYGTVRHAALIRKGSNVFFAVDGVQHGIVLSTTYRPPAAAMDVFIGNYSRAWIDAMAGAIFWCRLTDHYRYDPVSFPFTVPAQPT